MNSVPRCYEYAEERLRFRTVTIVYADRRPEEEYSIRTVSLHGTFGPPDIHWSRALELAAVAVSETRIEWRLHVDLPLARFDFAFRVSYDDGQEPAWRTSARYEDHANEARGRVNRIDVLSEAAALPRHPLYESLCEAEPKGGAAAGPGSLLACMVAALRLHARGPAHALADLARALGRGVRFATDHESGGPLNLPPAHDPDGALERSAREAVPGLAPLAISEVSFDILERCLCPIGLEVVGQALKRDSRDAQALRTLLVTFAGSVSGTLPSHSVLLVSGGPLPPDGVAVLDPVPRLDELQRGPDGGPPMPAERGAAALQCADAGAARAYLSRELFGLRQTSTSFLVRVCELSLPAAAPAAGSPEPARPPRVPCEAPARRLPFEERAVSGPSCQDQHQAALKLREEVLGLRRELSAMREKNDHKENELEDRARRLEGSGD